MKHDTEHRDAPVCPKCGAVEDPIDTAARHPRDGKMTPAHCSTCGTAYAVTAHVTVTYSTEVRS